MGHSLRPVADEHTLTLVLSGSDTLLVENDRQLVYRMVQNLIINAIKYTHKGSVRVQWGEAEDRWWFEVVDTGPGLNQELVNRLNLNELTSSRPGHARPGHARPGHDGPSGLASQRGEGIGLRIVRELAQLLEAQLQVSSETGVGTRFLISLPLHYTDA